MAARRFHPNLRRRLAVERLEPRELLAADFGDAPAPYPTLLANNGARHEAVGPTLGATRDLDADGQPTAAADGDGADDDGVTFGDLHVGQLGATVTVNVQNAPAGAKLDAWIDFNGDGSWGGANERIAFGAAVIEGDNLLTFDVPARALSGTTFARFRVSTAGDLGPGGAAADGEVEDYAVTITPPARSVGAFADKQVIGPTDGFTRVRSADLDGDGDADLITTTLTTVQWHENRGAEGFVVHAIGAVPDADPTAIDLDGDGDLDLLAGTTGGVEWLENDGAQAFTRRTIRVSPNAGAHTAQAADFDGDGDLDVVVGSKANGVVVLENDGQQTFAVRSTVAHTQFAALTVADVDRDGAMDYVVGLDAFNIGSVTWHRNTGNFNFSAIYPFQPSSGFPVLTVTTGDLDRDGDLDILAGGRQPGALSMLVWFEQTANGQFTRRTISATSGETFADVFAADMDGDGDLDLTTRKFGNSSLIHTVEFFENRGPGGFTRRFNTTASVSDFSVADVDGDNAADLVGIESASGLAWFANIKRVDLDFGDAPAPYPTMDASEGALHGGGGPRLGPLRDVENDGQPSAAADGDGADDDGVTFGELHVGSLSASVTVNVQNAPAGARLDAWIDFDGDGSWGREGERIAASAAVVAGDNDLSFAVPSWATAGATFARFRISLDGGLGPNWSAADGEVEDYAVVIEPAAAATGIFGEGHLIWQGSSYFMVTADMDRDGDTDVVSPGRWFENLGAAGFESHAISFGNIGSENYAAADLDSDGDLDIVGMGGNGQFGGVVWAENDGQQNFTPRGHYITGLPHGSWTGVAIVDVDGDGDNDVLAARLFGNGDYLLINNGSEQFTSQLLGTFSEGISIVATDMDRDGDFDVVAGGRGSSEIRWYENGGGLAFTHRTVKPQPATFSRTEFLDVGDLDGDGDMDVVAAGSTGLSWFEQTPGAAFVEHSIDLDYPRRSVALADFDADGDLDVLSGGNAVPITFYVNSGNGSNFVRRPITAGWSRSDANAAVDMDGDGDLDVVAMGVAPSGGLAWFANLSEDDADYGDAPAPYPTLETDDGARHFPVGPRLGASRDVDADGQPSAAADGDGADEDGVTFGELRVGQQGATVTVNVQNAPVGAKLDAWIDFNGDGSWGGPDERIASGFAVVEGDNALTFDVPSSAAPGATFARVRLSTAGGLTTRGLAADGEVEDYQVIIAPTPSATGVFGPARGHSSTTSFLTDAVTADLDGDGRLDIITRGGSNIAWHRNLGDGGFARTQYFLSATGSFVRAVDLDSDGDLDLVTTNSLQVVWLENDGFAAFTQRTASVALYDTVQSLDAADIDGDGDCDLIVASGSTANGAVLVNDGSENFTRLAVGSFDELAAADMDHDGDLDLVGAYAQSFPFFGEIAWLEHDGALGFVPRSISPTPAPAGSETRFDVVVPVDMDRDGDLDVVVAGQHRLSPPVAIHSLVWYEQQNDASFVAHGVEITNRVSNVRAADFDGDGDVDLLAIYEPSTGDNLELAYYENSGSQFVRRVLAETRDPNPVISFGDLDGDGDLDVTAGRIGTNNVVAWFENQNLHDADYGDAPAPYPTTRAASGAVHGGGGPRLGALRDAEADGAPSAQGDGDAGDDGVALPPIVSGQTVATVVVNVQNAPTGARLDAWIDFDGDGTWSGAGEQVFASRDVVEGDNELFISLPPAIAAGPTAARFRVSTAGRLRFDGAALDGEVEDYLVPIAAPAASTGEFALPDGPVGIDPVRRVADLDGDGDLDAMAIATLGGSISWYENLGDGAFLNHYIGAGSGLLGGRPADFDRDGDVDFVVVLSNGIGWYENNGRASFAYHAPTLSIGPLRGVFDLGDVDGDGDLDVVASRGAATSQQLAVLINDGQQRFPAQQSFTLTTPIWPPAAIRLADIDGDGDLDCAAAFQNSPAGAIGWFENDVKTWTYRELRASGAEQVAGRDVTAADIDGDGDVDLVTTAIVQNQFVIDLYRREGANLIRETLVATPWASIAPTPSDRLHAADLDGDGDLDLVASDRHGVWVLRNGGAQGFAVQQITSPLVSIGFTISVGDFNGDGVVEILSAGGLLFPFPPGDYDRNGVVDDADRTLYEQTLGQPAVPAGAGADGDRSGAVDAPDLAIWEANQGQRLLRALYSADFDFNAVVDGNDFLIWQRRLGDAAPPGYFPWDADRSGGVDSGDLALWRRHYGQGVGAGENGNGTPSIAADEAPAATRELGEPEAATSETAAPLFVLPASALLMVESPLAPVRPPQATRRRGELVTARDAAIGALVFRPRVASRGEWLADDAVDEVAVVTDVDSVKADLAAGVLAGLDELLGGWEWSR